MMPFLHHLVAAQWVKSASIAAGGGHFFSFFFCSHDHEKNTMSLQSIIHPFI